MTPCNRRTSQQEGSRSVGKPQIPTGKPVKAHQRADVLESETVSKRFRLEDRHEGPVQQKFGLTDRIDPLAALSRFKFQTDFFSLYPASRRRNYIG